MLLIDREKSEPSVWSLLDGRAYTATDWPSLLSFISIGPAPSFAIAYCGCCGQKTGKT